MFHFCFGGTTPPVRYLYIQTHTLRTREIKRTIMMSLLYNSQRNRGSIFWYFLSLSSNSVFVYYNPPASPLSYTHTHTHTHTHIIVVNTNIHIHTHTHTSCTVRYTTTYRHPVRIRPRTLTAIRQSGEERIDGENEDVLIHSTHTNHCLGVCRCVGRYVCQWRPGTHRSLFLKIRD